MPSSTRTMTRMFIDGQYFTRIREGNDLFYISYVLATDIICSATIFSAPNYSAMSLLPMDPLPFTIPSGATSPRKGQPTVSLSSYPLPDGNWRWVSRTWMVDMRGDGQTQYDGFEYNWFFRGKRWRAEVGRLNAGGWVRRRRWVRLMVRPARSSQHNEARGSGKSTPGDIPHLDHSQSASAWRFGEGKEKMIG